MTNAKKKKKIRNRRRRRRKATTATTRKITPKQSTQSKAEEQHDEGATNLLSGPGSGEAIQCSEGEVIPRRVSDDSVKPFYEGERTWTGCLIEASSVAACGAWRGWGVIYLLCVY